jgi:hypothetical protein
MDDAGARLEHARIKLLKCLAHESGVSKSSARTATELLKLRPYKTTAIQALKPRDPAIIVHSCSWFLQSVVVGESSPNLIFFFYEAWLHLQGYINTQNNRYCSSQTQHLTHPMKVGVWCAVSARIVAPAFFNETVN